MDRPSILIVGAGPLQCPAIIAARNLGYRVIAADVVSGAPGLCLADQAVIVRKGDVDSLVCLGRSCGIAAVFSIASDLLAVQAARIASQLGLPSVSEEAATRATRKDLMRQALAAAGVPIPLFSVISDPAKAAAALDITGLPAVIKPVDASGSRGVVKIRTARDVPRAFEFSMQHSPAGRLIIESYMPGREVSVEAWTSRGKTSIVMITDKLLGPEPFFVEMGHSQPADLPQAIRDEIHNLVIRAVAALGIEHGATHTEVKLTPLGLRVVELGPRLGGDYITSHLVRISAGVDLVKATLELALGHEPNIIHQGQRGSAIRYFAPPPGLVTRVLPLPADVEGVVDLGIYAKPGDRVPAVTDSLKRSGHVITTAETAREAVRRAEAVLALNLIETVPVDGEDSGWPA